jgi:hypothetical protein
MCGAWLQVERQILHADVILAVLLHLETLVLNKERLGELLVHNVSILTPAFDS